MARYILAAAGFVNTRTGRAAEAEAARDGTARVSTGREATA